MRAQVAPSPADIDATPVPISAPSCGTERFTVVPSPSCPHWLYPQHLMPPVVINAHAYPAPALTAATPESRPVTSTGTAESVNVVPLPSSPWLSSPQHTTPPAIVNAQLFPPPTDTAATPEPNPDTSTGTLELEN